MRRLRISIAPFAFAARHRAFAARLLGIGARDGWAPPVPGTVRRPARFTLRQIRMPVLVQVHMHAHSTVAAGASRLVLASPPASHMETIRRERSHVVTRHIERVTRLLQLRQSVLRLSVPVPATATPEANPARERVPTVQRVEHQRVYPRVTQVVARAVAAPPPARDRAEPARPAVVESRLAPPSGAWQPPAPGLSAIPPAELSRVTDHVIKQLDRRVLSYRERMGRI